MKTFAENSFIRSLTVKIGVFDHKPQSFSLFHFFPGKQKSYTFSSEKAFSDHGRQKTARHLPSQRVKTKQKRKRVFRALHGTLSFLKSKNK